MKKYLLGIIAIVLAVGITSFTTPEKKPADVYYFYVVDGTGSIPSGSPIQFSGNAVTLSFADTWDGCTGTTYDCMRGFLTPPSLPTSASGDVQTKKN